jgi:hypothetical protein
LPTFFDIGEAVSSVKMRGTVGCSKPACGIWYHAAMKQFFHGWRRKLGVAALVVACAVFVVWMRGYMARDRFHFGTGQTHGCLTSEGGHVQYTRSDVGKDGIDRIAANWENWEDYLEELQNLPGVERSSVERWECSGFLYCVIHDGDLRANIWVIPYWSLVLPFTVFSAYLILWKPRKRV